MDKPIWSDLSLDEHEFQYNPRCSVPGYEMCNKKHQSYSERAIQTLEVVRDVSYGEHALRRLDIYPASTGTSPAPVHVFIHGGYWRAMDKRDFALIPATLAPLGITSVLVNYELCPSSTLSAVVDSVISAFDWVVRKIENYGGDPSRLSLSGHSAGAHLGAAIIAHPWQTEMHLLEGAVLTCGIYDPAPAVRTTVNEEIKLTYAEAERNNQEKRVPHLQPDIVIMAGACEPWQWVDQSFRYYRHLRFHDMEPTLHVLPGRDHFNFLDEYMDDSSLVVKAILRHCKVGSVT